MREEKNDVFVYEYHDGLYINPTNRCTNNCVFCLRNDKSGVGGHELWLDKEPSSEEIIFELQKYSKPKMITFCGYGEPMIRLDIIKEVSLFAKENRVKIKVDTNGQANMIHNRDILPELIGLVDIFSISLNTDNSKDYRDTCKSKYGENAYKNIIDFAKKSVEYGFETILTVVDFIGQKKIESCKKIAKNIGAGFRVRHMS